MKYNQNFPKGNNEEMPSVHSASLLKKGLRLPTILQWIFRKDKTNFFFENVMLADDNLCRAQILWP